MIKFENVIKSYNGTTGCMCGCKGKYSIPSHVEPDELGDELCSDRSVKIAVNKVNKFIDWNNPEMVAKHVNSNHAWIHTTGWGSGNIGRTTVVYF